MPDLNADRRADNHHLAPRLNTQKLAKPFGNQEAALAGQLNGTVTGRKETAQHLKLWDFVGIITGLLVKLNELDTFAELFLPRLLRPETDTTGAFLYQNAITLFIDREELGELLGREDSSDRPGCD